jgi:hypothetical protein
LVPQFADVAMGDPLPGGAVNEKRFLRLLTTLAPSFTKGWPI